MDDFYINNISLHEGYNNNIKYDNENNTITPIRDEEVQFIDDVVLCIIISIGLPLTLVAIYGLYSQVRDGQVAPIYIINLLISDLIQLCSMISFVRIENFIVDGIFKIIYGYSLTASVGFMMCVSLERYLVVAWPLWYRFRRNIKTSVVICVVVWILPLLLLFLLPTFIGNASKFILGVFHLLPLPLFIFSLFGTIKALSAAISVPPDEKRRIVATLVLVLLIYTLLFLPAIILLLAEEARNNNSFSKLTVTLIMFSPLADLFLYVFSRKGAVDKFLASVCRCGMNSDRDQHE